jgi:sec-independent protein translocase protein TatC
MAEMTFWDHLDELRKVLFRVVGVWFVLAIGYFIAMPYLFDHVILAPCHNDFIFYDLLRNIASIDLSIFTFLTTNEM